MKINMQTRNKLTLVITAGMLLTAVSCQKNVITGHLGCGVSTILPKVSSLAYTKSAEEGDGRLITTYTISEDSDNPLYLQVFEKDITELPFDAPATKGTEITSENLSSFKMTAFAEDKWYDPTVPEGQPGSITDKYDAGEFFQKIAVTKKNETWSMSATKYWIQDVPITFWSWYSSNTYFGGPLFNFDYYEGYEDLYAYYDGYFVSDGNYHDLVFAYNREKRTVNGSGKISGSESSNPDYTRTDNEMDIHFYHALSAIRFDVSGLTGAVLKKASLKNIISRANLYIPVPSDGKLQFTWTSTGSYLTTYNQMFDASDFQSDGSMVSGSSKDLFLIPQKMRDNAELEITLVKESDPADIVKITASIAKLNASDTDNVRWEAGKYYTYKLTSNPFAYIWEYEFSLPKPSLSDPTTQIETYNVQGYDLAKYIDISSLKVRQDKPSVGGSYGYHISAYQLEGEDMQSVEGSFSEPAAGMTNVSVNSSGRLVLSIAKKTLDIKGTNTFWRDEEDKIVNPLWHPDDWVSQTSSSNPIDLSRMDYRKDDISQSRDAFLMSTANCYVIRHAGWYKLPLVYGNAILGGSPNTDAYKPFPSDTNDNDLTLGIFKNHLDANITSPYIENNAGCDAASCEVLWQANGPVVQSLQFDKGGKTTDYTASDVRYLIFYANPAYICQNNALIAIKDAEGRIIWSWQIWTTNDPALLDEPIKVTNYSGKDYYFMNIPSIGRVLNQEYPRRPDITIWLEQDSPSTEPPLKLVVKQPAIKYAGEFVVYQFGRKDPIRGAGTTIPTAPGPVSLGTLIQNPGIFYTFNTTGSSLCPNSPKFKNLWSGKHTTVNGNAQEQDSYMLKTIYDPSPLGYKVPASGAFTGFTTTGEHAFKTALHEWNIESTNVAEIGGGSFYTSLGEGYSVKGEGPTIWFPIDGMRAGLTGDLYSSEMYYSCNFRQIGANSTTLSYMFDVSDNSVGLGTASPCNGHNIRSVTDPGFTLWWTGTGAPR